MESRVTHVVGILSANFQLAMPFHSRLSVRHGTDRQTDMPRPIGWGIKYCILMAQFVHKIMHIDGTVCSLIVTVLQFTYSYISVN